MDLPGLEKPRHDQALLALTRINLLSLTAHRVWMEVRRLLEIGPRPLRILDVACGGGDVPLGLMARAKREGVRLEVHACDLSATALAHARERVQERGVEVRLFQMDATEGPLPGGFDLVCSSLFLHHLTEEEVVRLLSSMALAGRAVLVQDLLRTRLGYLLALATMRLVTRSDVARVDAVRSVESAFSLQEIWALAQEAGLGDGRVARCWPERFSLSWRRR